MRRVGGNIYYCVELLYDRYKILEIHHIQYKSHKTRTDKMNPGLLGLIIQH